MLDKLKDLDLRYEDLESQLGDPRVYGDAEKLRQVNRELKELLPVVETYRAYQAADSRRREAEELRELVSALARELAIAQPRIALMGGLLAEENVYREAVCAALSGMAQPVRPLHDALWGAAQLAFEALGE